MLVPELERPTLVPGWALLLRPHSREAAVLVPELAWQALVVGRVLLQRPHLREAAVLVPELERPALVLGRVLLQQQQQQLREALVLVPGLALELLGPAAEQAMGPAPVPGPQRRLVRLLRLWPFLQKRRELSLGRVC